MTPPVTGEGEVKDHNANTEMEKTSFPALRCSSSREKRRILTPRVRGSEFRARPGQPGGQRGLPEEGA